MLVNISPHHTVIRGSHRCRMYAASFAQRAALFVPDFSPQAHAEHIRQKDAHAKLVSSHPGMFKRSKTDTFTYAAMRETLNGQGVNSPLEATVHNSKPSAPVRPLKQATQVRPIDSPHAFLGPNGVTAIRRRYNQCSPPPPRKLLPNGSRAATPMLVDPGVSFEGTRPSIAYLAVGSPEKQRHEHNLHRTRLALGSPSPCMGDSRVLTPLTSTVP